MNILVIGATGGSGRAVCAALLARGHTVTALSRSAGQLESEPGLTRFPGDATDAAVLDEVLPGHDGVVVALGIAEPTLRVRVRGARSTPADVRSRGTREVLAAAERAGVRRVVVQSSYGVGPTRDRLGLLDRAFFALLIKPQIADTERQESVVRASALDWTIVQPVHLHDADERTHHVSVDGSTRLPRVSRRAVAEVHADLVATDRMLRETVAVSG